MDEAVINAVGTCIVTDDGTAFSAMPPAYYDVQEGLVTMDLWVPEMPPGFNEVPEPETESMIQFHIYSMNVQVWGRCGAGMIS